MDISKALQIEGWMSEAELTWLAEQASQKKMIVEIGSWEGRSTRALADNTDGVVFAVDTWEGSKEEVHEAFLRTKPKDWLLDKFRTNLVGCRAQICVRKMLSTIAAAMLSNYKFDMIFIDGSHDYSHVKEDILTWQKLLAPNGLICGHDYESWPGVTQAVDEIYPTHGRAAESIWYV